MKKEHVEKALKVVQKLLQPLFIHFPMKTQKFCFCFQVLRIFLVNAKLLVEESCVCMSDSLPPPTGLAWSLVCFGISCIDCFWYVVFCMGKCFITDLESMEMGPEWLSLVHCKVCYMVSALQGNTTASTLCCSAWSVELPRAWTESLHLPFATVLPWVPPLEHAVLPWIDRQALHTPSRLDPA